MQKEIWRPIKGYEGLYEILKDLYPEEFEDTDPEM